jgi:hypothetical protein
MKKWSTPCMRWNSTHSTADSASIVKLAVHTDMLNSFCSGSGAYCGSRHTGKRAVDRSAEAGTSFLSINP